MFKSRQNNQPRCACVGIRQEFQIRSRPWLWKNDTANFDSAFRRWIVADNFSVSLWNRFVWQWINDEGRSARSVFRSGSWPSSRCGNSVSPSHPLSFGSQGWCNRRCNRYRRSGELPSSPAERSMCFNLAKRNQVDAGRKDLERIEISAHIPVREHCGRSGESRRLRA